MRSAAPISLCACLALAACASKPKPDLRLPAAYEAPQPAASTPAVALDNWWTTFHDPQLTTLIEQALVYNPDAKTAAARLREASGARSAALTAFLPQGNPNASFTRSNTKGGLAFDIPGLASGGITDTSALNFPVSWEVDIFGRLFAAKQSANADVAARRLRLRSRRAPASRPRPPTPISRRVAWPSSWPTPGRPRGIQRKLYEVATARARRAWRPAPRPIAWPATSPRPRPRRPRWKPNCRCSARTLLILAGRIVEPTATSTRRPSSASRRPSRPPCPATCCSAGRTCAAPRRSWPARGQPARRPHWPSSRPSSSDAGLRLVEDRDAEPRRTPTQTWSIGGAVDPADLSIPRLLAELKTQRRPHRAGRRRL